MYRTLLFIALLCGTHSSYGVDKSNSMTETNRIGSWQVIEFAAPTQLIYRLASTSINDPRANVVFDFVPSKGCDPGPAVMIFEFESYIESLDGGQAIYAYKISNHTRPFELVETVMSKGDRFAFFRFNQLTTEFLLGSNDKGRLSVWTPASGDGVVKRSSNIYFSLDGISSAYQEAFRKCSEGE